MRVGMKTTSLVVLALSAAAANAGEYYRWVDDKGVVHYSDRPSSKKAQVTEVKPASAGQSGPAAAQPPAQEGDAQPDRASEVRSEQCAKAQKRLTTYREADRLLLTEADGTQREMTADEKIESILRAEKQTEAFCGESG